MALTRFASSMVTFIQAGVSAFIRSLEDKLRDHVSVKDFGAKGDGVTNDTVAIQAALDYGILKSKLVRIPAGNYQVGTLKLSTGAMLLGDGPVATEISGKLFGAGAPVFVNKDPAFIGYLDIRGFTVSYGSDGFKFVVSSETAYCNFADMSIRFQTGDNMYFNKLMQLANFTNVHFSDSARGLICAAFTANLNSYTNCRWGNHRFESIQLTNSEVNVFTNCSFENAVPDANGVWSTNSTTIIAFGASNLTFINCYAENGHRRFLSTTSDSTTRFIVCHFTTEMAAIFGTAIGYAFAAADGSVVTFEGCSFTLPPRKEGTISFAGNNNAGLKGTALLTSRSQGKMAAISRDVNEVGPQGAKTSTVMGAKDVLQIDCSANGSGMIMGILTIQVQTLAVGGNSYKQYYGRFRLFASRIAGIGIQLNELVPMETFASANDAAGQLTCVVAKNTVTSTASMLVLKATIGGIVYEPAAGYGQMTVTFESTGHSEGAFLPNCIA